MLIDNISLHAIDVPPLAPAPAPAAPALLVTGILTMFVRRAQIAAILRSNAQARPDFISS